MSERLVPSLLSATCRPSLFNSVYDPAELDGEWVGAYQVLGTDASV